MEEAHGWEKVNPSEKIISAVKNSNECEVITTVPECLFKIQNCASSPSLLLAEQRSQRVTFFHLGINCIM